MAREIRARYSRGKIEPLEDLGIKEGEIVYISVRQVPEETPKREAGKDGLERSAGSWEGTLDFDEYLKDLYASRRSQSPEVNL